MKFIGLMQLKWLSAPVEWVFLFVDIFLVFFIVINIIDINRFVVRKTVISSPKIPKGKEVTFVFLTDLHSRKFKGNNEGLLEEIRKCHPDFILCGGDMMTARPGKNNEAAVSFMNRLSKEYKVYYAMGNHEYRSGIYPETYGTMFPDYKKAVSDDNIVWLDNETICIRVTGRDSESPDSSSVPAAPDEPVKLTISGLTIDKDYYKRFVKQTLPAGYVKEQIGPVSDETFHILLAHNPDFGDDYFDYGADLFLSGHLHGGIIRLPFIGGVASPAFRLFPKYNGGLYRENGHCGYVSCGLGTHTVPMRFLNPGEVSVITLKD